MSSSRGSLHGPYSAGLRSKQFKTVCLPARSLLSRPRVLTFAANTSDNFQESAQRLARSAQEKVNDFLKEQDLQRKAEKAAKELKKTAQDTYDRVELKARRTYSKLDYDFQLNAKAQKAAKRVEEAVRDVDQQYSVRRNIRNWKELVQKKWPIWRKRLDEFSNTTAGKVVILGLLVVVLSSPLFWRVVNFVLLLWWLSVPLSIVLVNYASKKQAERFEQEQEKVREQQRRRNPFADIFSSNPSPARNGSSGVKGKGGRTQQDGPIIDAEWTSLDD